jgi:hypothetical protein
MKSAFQALRRVSIFAGLSDDALSRIARVAHARAYELGHGIMFEGDPCQAVYFVAAGQVRAYRLSPSGREQVLARLGPGQSFNTVSPFQPQGAITPPSRPSLKSPSTPLPVGTFAAWWASAPRWPWPSCETSPAGWTT